MHHGDLSTQPLDFTAAHRQLLVPLCDEGTRLNQRSHSCRCRRVLVGRTAISARRREVGFVKLLVLHHINITISW